jgi:hypothetical protein
MDSPDPAHAGALDTRRCVDPPVERRWTQLFLSALLFFGTVLLFSGSFDLPFFVLLELFEQRRIRAMCFLVVLSEFVF